MPHASRYFFDRCTHWLLIGALCPGAALAQSTPVYRCGTSYQSQPCASGPSQPLPPVDQPDAQRREQARAVAESEARAARLLQQEREERERHPNATQSAGGLPTRNTVRPLPSVAEQAEPAAPAASAPKPPKKHKHKTKKKTEGAEADEDRVVKTPK